MSAVAVSLTKKQGRKSGPREPSDRKSHLPLEARARLSAGDAHLIGLAPNSGRETRAPTPCSAREVLAARAMRCRSTERSQDQNDGRQEDERRQEPPVGRRRALEPRSRALRGRRTGGHRRAENDGKGQPSAVHTAEERHRREVEPNQRRGRCGGDEQVSDQRAHRSEPPARCAPSAGTPILWCGFRGRTCPSDGEPSKEKICFTSSSYSVTVVR